MLVGHLCVLKDPEDHPDLRVQTIPRKTNFWIADDISWVAKWFLSKEYKSSS